MDIRQIRENPDFVKDNQIKRFCDSKIVDNILEYDKKFVKDTFLNDKYNQLKNLLTKDIRKKKGKDMNLTEEFDSEKLFNELYDLMIQKSFTEINNVTDKLSKGNLIELAKFIDERIKSINPFLYLKERDKLIHSLGNLLHNSVPIDTNEDNNQVICKHWDHKFYNHANLDSNLESINQNPIDVNFGFGLTHDMLCEKLGIVNTTAGTRVVGHRGYYLLGAGARLSMALMMYSVDFLQKKGFNLISVPQILNEDVMETICQLEEFRDTLYRLQMSKNDNEKMDKYLIATSEQSMTAYHKDFKFRSNDLPIKWVCVSNCFRREAGAHGVDNKGILRVHQYTKAEEFCITTHDKSYEMMEEMINTVKEFYQSLNLSYRIVNIVSGALNNAASKKYDLEAWFAGSKTYRELVSCSNTLDFFSKRLNVKDNKKNYVHMLNSTLCADTRTMCCLLEQYQTNDGVVIPEVLRPYMGGLDIIPFNDC